MENKRNRPLDACDLCGKSGPEAPIVAALPAPGGSRLVCDACLGAIPELAADETGTLPGKRGPALAPAT